MPVALIVVDMQVVFESVAKPIVNKLQTVIQECRYQKVPVFLTQHGHKDTTQEATLVQKWGKKGSIKHGSPAWQLLPPIKDVMMEEDAVVEKDSCDAFQGTDLEAQLHQRGITSVAIAGVLTNPCCEAFARGAHERNLDVMFLKDATSSPEMQAATEATEAQEAKVDGFVNENDFVKVLSTQEFLSQMEELAKAPTT